MHRILCFVLGVLSVLLWDGCATSTPDQATCESCSYGYRRVSRRHTQTTVTCVIDGKIVDCKRNPAECPECAKRMQENKRD